MDTHSQEVIVVEEVKPYVFKRHVEDLADGKKNTYFKVYKRPVPEKDAEGNKIEPTELLEGFEEEAFNSPLVGHRYINGILAALDEKLKATIPSLVVTSDMIKRGTSEQQAGDESTKTQTLAGVDAGDAQQIARAIEKSVEDEHGEARDQAKFVAAQGNRLMYKIVVPKQSNTDMNRLVYVPNHDGGKDWYLERGKEYTVPQYVVSILKESIATSTSYDFQTDPQGVKAIPTIDRTPRFSLQINEVIRI